MVSAEPAGKTYPWTVKSGRRRSAPRSLDAAPMSLSGWGIVALGRLLSFKHVWQDL